MLNNVVSLIQCVIERPVFALTVGLPSFQIRFGVVPFCRQNQHSVSVWLHPFQSLQCDRVIDFCCLEAVHIELDRFSVCVFDLAERWIRKNNLHVWRRLLDRILCCDIESLSPQNLCPVWVQLVRERILYRRPNQKHPVPGRGLIHLRVFSDVAKVRRKKRQRNRCAVCLHFHAGGVSHSENWLSGIQINQLIERLNRRSSLFDDGSSGLHDPMFDCFIECFGISCARLDRLPDNFTGFFPCLGDRLVVFARNQLLSEMPWNC